MHNEIVTYISELEELLVQVEKDTIDGKIDHSSFFLLGSIIEDLKDMNKL